MEAIAPGRVNWRLRARPAARRLLLAILAGALLLRAAAVVLLPPEEGILQNPLADSADFHHLAVSLLAGEGFASPTGQPTAFRPPAYPVFLATVYTAAGHGNILATGLAQALLGTLNCWLAYLLARRTGLARPAALLPATLFALYPAFVYQTPQILGEVTGRTHLLAAAILFLRAAKRHTPTATITAGALFALAVLNKPPLAASLPFLVILLAWCRGHWRAPLLFALAAGLLLGAWTARNAAVSGRFIPVSTNFPITFAQGVTQWSYYTQQWYGEQRALLDAPDDFLRLTQLRAYDSIGEEIATGEEWQSRAIEFIRENPGFYLTLTARKTLHYWGPFISNRPLERAAALATMLPVLVLGWIGLIRCLAAGPPAARRFALLALCIAIPTCLPHVLSQPDVRYRLAFADPLWIVLLPWALLLLRYLWRNG